MDDPWCRNHLTISSSNEQSLSAFRATLNTPTSKGTAVLFSLHQAVPRPDGQKEGKNEWALKNWGCHCDDLRGVYIGEYPGRICVTFSSPYKSPIEWMKRVAARFNVMVTGDYINPGEKTMDIAIGPEGVIKHQEHIWMTPISTSSEEESDNLFDNV